MFLELHKDNTIPFQKLYAGLLWEVPSTGQLNKIIWEEEANKHLCMCVKSFPSPAVSAELDGPEPFHGLGAASTLTTHQPASSPSTLLPQVSCSSDSFILMA